MLHTIKGNNFHGNYSIILRGPAAGFELSKKQAKKYLSELCGLSDCRCGGKYGDGPDPDSATVTHIDYDRLYLSPAPDEDED